MNNNIKKRIIIIHGWGGSPKEAMHQWLKSELVKEGMEVLIPEMPDTENPRIEQWIKKIKDIVEEPDKDTILVGHSVGCQAILRYLEKLHLTKRVGGIVLIAPWIILSNLEDDEEWEIIKPWLETPIEDASVIIHTKKIVAIFSNNDPFIPRENIDLFKQKFDAEIIIEEKKGHFCEDDGVKELPSALDAILKTTNQ